MDDPLEGMFDMIRREKLEEAEKQIDRSVESIFEALEREPLNGLKYGDVLKQRSFGVDYRYTGGAIQRPVFIRYVTPAVAKHWESGERVDEADIIIACGIHKPDGSLLVYAVDSRHYEKA